MNGFADRIECTAPMAVRSRTMNAPWPRCCGPEFPCANRKSTSSGRTASASSLSLTSKPSRIATETLSAPSIASKTSPNASGRKSAKTHSREVDHRAKNLLALVQATVQLTHARHCQRLQGGNRWPPPSAIKCPYAPRAITLGGSRPAQSGHGRTCSLSRSGEVAREHQRSYTRFGTKSGTDDCDGSARANDERGQIWGSVGSFRSASS